MQNMISGGFHLLEEPTLDTSRAGVGREANGVSWTGKGADRARDRERRSGNSLYRIDLGEMAAIRKQTRHEPDVLGKSTACDYRGASGRLLDAYEEAARLVAQRLHDECDQILAVVYLELDRISRDCPEETARKIDGVVKLLDGVCEETRRLSHELRPPLLDQFGLLAALQFLADGFTKRWGLEIVVPDSSIDLPPAVEIALYRVVHAALSNVVRHASATRAEVRVWETPGNVYCIVRDNGIGFTAPSGDSSTVGGLGLVGIYERVIGLDGDCSIVSCRRNDTHFMELRVEIPI